MKYFIETIFKRHKEILAILITCVLAVFIINYLLSPVYESEAKIMVGMGKETATPTTVLTQPMTMVVERSNYVNTQIQILESRAVVEGALGLVSMEKPAPEGILGTIRHYIGQAISGIFRAFGWVLETLQLTSPLSETERQVIKIMKNIKVTGVKDSDILVITFRDKDPEFAQKFLTAYINSYLTVSTRGVSASGSMEFFNEQAAAAKLELAKAQQDLTRYRQENGLYAVPEQRESMAKDLGYLATERMQAELDVSLYKGKLGEIKDFQGDIEVLVPMDMRLDQATIELLKNLAFVKNRLAERLSTLGAAHPDILSTVDAVKNLRSVIRQELTGITQARLSEAERRLKSLTAQEQTLFELASTLDARALGMKALEDKAELLAKAVASYEERSETSRINLQMNRPDISSVVVVQAPIMPFMPVSPKRILNLILSAIIGLALGIAYAFTREYLAGTINTPEDMRRIIGEESSVYYLPNMTSAEVGLATSSPGKGTLLPL